MAEKLVELSRDELERKIRGTRAERNGNADGILDGRGWYKNGDEHFVLRGSKVADFVRRRIAGPTAVASPSTAAAAPASSPAVASLKAAPVAAVEHSKVASLDARRRSTIMENAGRHVDKVLAKGTTAGGSIMGNANAFSARELAKREERARARLGQGDPKGAA